MTRLSTGSPVEAVSQDTPKNIEKQVDRTVRGVAAAHTVVGREQRAAA